VKRRSLNTGEIRFTNDEVPGAREKQKSLSGMPDRLFTFQRAVRR
jgi:hypothetical protein